MNHFCLLFWFWLLLFEPVLTLFPFQMFFQMFWFWTETKNCSTSTSIFLLFMLFSCLFMCLVITFKIQYYFSSSLCVSLYSLSFCFLCSLFWSCHFLFFVSSLYSFLYLCKCSWLFCLHSLWYLFSFSLLFALFFSPFLLCPSSNTSIYTFSVFAWQHLISKRPDITRCETCQETCDVHMYEMHALNAIV